MTKHETTNNKDMACCLLCEYTSRVSCRTLALLSLSSLGLEHDSGGATRHPGKGGVRRAGGLQDLDPGDPSTIPITMIIVTTTTTTTTTTTATTTTTTATTTTTTTATATTTTTPTMITLIMIITITYNSAGSG